MDPKERKAILLDSKRFLGSRGPRLVRRELDRLTSVASTDDRADSYGTGPAIELLEEEVARILGKPAAVFMPSGVMAQQIALRIYADRSACRTVAFHPTCHLELHEQRGYSHLHQLHARLVGRRDRLITRADLDAVSEPVCALLLELPQREIGGELPSWDELSAQVAWARERQVAVHMDGARLWETAPFYQRPYAEISGLFDSVYVSFYKVLGGIAGAALAGPVDFIAEARVWQRRHGGTLVSMYPCTISAQEGLRTRLPQMAALRQRAVRVAEILSEVPGVRVTPNPPHTNMMHAYLPVDAEQLLDAGAELATQRQVTLFANTRPCDLPGYCAVEITISEAADGIDDDELVVLLRELLDNARQRPVPAR